MEPVSRAPATTDDPIDVLLAEHRTILAVVDEVDRERARLERDGVLRAAFWRDVLRFAAEFDGALHHHKEELLLFRALEAAGLDPASGPTAVLRDEHQRTQVWVARLEQALAARDRLRLAAAATGYGELVRAHVRKEDQILFPLARRVLDATQRAALASAFAPLAADTDVRAWLRAAYPFPALD